MARFLPAEDQRSWGAGLSGAGFALVTAMFWGALPMALKQLMEKMDPATIVWLRFSTAAAWLWLGRRAGGSLAPGWRVRWLLLLAALGLGGNFVLYNASVEYLSAPATQLVAQLGAMLLMLGSVLFLGEPFLPVQLAGVPTLLLGFLLFFNTGLLHLAEGGLGAGLFIGVAAAAVWAAYGVIQKVLLACMAPQLVLRWLYTLCAIGFTPFASPSELLELDWAQSFCLIFACLNTVVAYGAFGRAMALWHTAKVGALITVAPLFTLLFAWLGHRITPFFPPAQVSLLNLAGACLVVCGVALIAAGPLLRPLPACLLPGRGKNSRGRRV